MGRETIARANTLIHSARDANRVRRIDLHTHSTASDGTDVPANVARLAARAGLAAFALTDHDTLAGIPDARAAAEDAGVELVVGVELSARVPHGEMHVLGYLVAEDHPGFRARLAELRDSRRLRAHRIVERLQHLGLAITDADVAAQVGDASPGRPHVAHALVAKGLARDVQQAFDLWLGRGKPAHVARDDLSPGECVGLVQKAGGVAVLAHPSTLPRDALGAAVADLARRGLAGIEVEHPRNDEALRGELHALAKEHDLVATGGSDYHGRTKPGVEIGTGLGGNVSVAYEALEALRERA